MMFDDRFSQCKTVDDSHSLYEQLIKLTPLDSRHFLKRALNKRLVQITDPINMIVEQIRDLPLEEKDSSGNSIDDALYRRAHLQSTALNKVMR